MSSKNLISLQQVSLAYRALPALADINWRFEFGQQWACLGPNGAGKTSLANVLSGIASHFSGDLEFGEAIEQQGVAYVCFEQQKALCERDKKLDDSEFRSDASDPGTPVRHVILGNRSPGADFDYWTERLNMRHILDRGLRFISTGETRKTLLVRALLSRPGLLILDSPLDGLDRDSQREMHSVLAELLASPQAVLLLCRQIDDIPVGITHVLALEAGRPLACGERETTLADARVRALMNPPIAPFAQLPDPAPRPYELPAQHPLLVLRNVAVKYGELQVLQDVNWTFARGDHCLVSGPNGCGKSTLLSLVTGDNHKAYGQDITLFGLRRGSGESVWDIKQKYGVLDTALHLNWVRGMKVVEVVISGFFDSNGLYDDWGDAQLERAEQWLAALGLRSISRDSFDALSFGMQRMALLARAMVKSPAILLLDEPSLGLDGHHRQLLLAAIDHIAEHSDTQIIFVSHSAGERPHCLNQHLQFVPESGGYRVQCSELESG